MKQNFSKKAIYIIMSILIVSAVSLLLYRYFFIHYDKPEYPDYDYEGDPLVIPSGGILPSIYIETEAADITKEEYIPTNITIKDQNNTIITDVLPGKVKGRGNSTWKYLGNKKPYKIKFEKKQNLFSMGNCKSYVLLSNQLDTTLIRNELAFYLASGLGLEYTPKYQQVHLYMNNKYMGVYLLCQQIDTGSAGIDIETKDGNSITNNVDVGYFLEFGGAVNHKDFVLHPVKDSTYNWSDIFAAEIKYPDEQEITTTRLAYISQYMEQLNSAILLKSWDKINELADIDSIVNYFLVYEILLNGDMGWSTYLYKPAGQKIHFGPVWDFDQSSGSSTFGSTAVKGFDVPTGSNNRWFLSLIEIPEFMNLLTERYNEMYDFIHSIPERIDYLSDYYKYDFSFNFIRWDILGKNRWRIPDELINLNTYEENIQYLKSWITARISWLDSVLKTT